jgi:hypothetical protein
MAGTCGWHLSKMPWPRCLAVETQGCITGIFGTSDRAPIKVLVAVEQAGLTPMAPVRTKARFMAAIQMDRGTATTMVVERTRCLGSAADA